MLSPINPGDSIAVHSSDGASNALRLGWLETADLTNEPANTYLSRGPILEEYGPDNDYLRLSRYPSGWALRADPGTAGATSCCLEMYLPGALSIGPNSSTTIFPDPHLIVRARFDGLSFSFNLSGPYTSPGYGIISIDNLIATATGPTVPWGYKFRTNAADGSNPTVFQIEADGSQTITSSNWHSVTVRGTSSAVAPEIWLNNGEAQTGFGRSMPTALAHFHGPNDTALDCRGPVVPICASEC